MAYEHIIIEAQHHITMQPKNHITIVIAVCQTASVSTRNRLTVSNGGVKENEENESLLNL